MKLLLKHDLYPYWAAICSMTLFLVTFITFIFVLIEAQAAETSIWLVSSLLLSSLLALACLYFVRRLPEKSGVELQGEGGHLARTAGVEDGVTGQAASHKAPDESLFDFREQLMDFASRLQAAREEERTSIAREIHDELGQKMTRLKIGLSLTRDSLKKRRSIRGLSREVNELQSTLALVDGLMHDVRRIAAELRPDELDDLGLTDAIRKSVDEYAMEGRFKCRFDSGRRVIGLDGQKSFALFRIFQEAMTNVLRHSGATAVDISLSKYRGRVRLEVADNGHGIEQNGNGKDEGLGILGMRERAISVGGIFSITKRKSGGTAVIVEVNA